MRAVLLLFALAISSPLVSARAQEPASQPGTTPSKAAGLIPTELRDKARAHGPALRLGDVFRIEGPAAAREIAPAPPPGEAGTYATAFLSAAARAAGYEWFPQAGFIQIAIEGPRKDEPQRPRSHFVETPSGPASPPAREEASSVPIIKRGEQITLSYSQGALRLSTRARALHAAALGESVRVLTLPAERQLEARVIGPGEASISQ